MTEHPCAKGLTPACFAAYPAYARQAFAYKLVHTILPKQVTKNLPRIIRTAFLAPGVTIPPGIDLPLGWVVMPGTIFPEGWKQGDPAPPGVIIPPEVYPTPPDKGAAPPTYVPPFGPGPIGGPTKTSPPAPQVEVLLAEQGATQEGTYWGDDPDMLRFAAWMNIDKLSKITKIKLRVGTYGNPTDNVHLEIWDRIGEGPPNQMLTGGAATPIPASELPPFALDQQYVTFTFPNKPTIDLVRFYFIVFYRSGPADYDNCYRIGNRSDYVGYWYWMWPDLNWYEWYHGTADMKIYGYEL